MKLMDRPFLIMVLLVSFFTALGCASKKGDYGNPITESKVTEINRILASPKDYDKKTVLVEGKIIEECPAGGWFMLKNDSGIMFVNLHPSYFAIPQAVGSWVVAQGVVRREDSQVSIVGKGVKIK